MYRFCRSLAWIAATFAALAFGVAAVPAQTGYPDRPVKIIVPIGPGGSYDLVGRHLADVLSKRTGQAFFVENKPGAGTVVGTQAAAQSEPDGYTLLMGGSPTWRSIRRCIRTSPMIRSGISCRSRWSIDLAM
jgi:tripartite-type tricarboxylate transporter receptor subunit TctC